MPGFGGIANETFVGMDHCVIYGTLDWFSLRSQHTRLTARRGAMDPPFPGSQIPRLLAVQLQKTNNRHCGMSTRPEGEEPVPVRSSPEVACAGEQLGQFVEP
jgi:hypothetical protein